MFSPMLYAALGTPGQLASLLVDSGSPLLWARSANTTHCPPAYSPAVSTSAKDLFKKQEFGYGSGVIEGPEYSDTLVLGSGFGVAPVFPQPLELITAVRDVP